MSSEIEVVPSGNKGMAKASAEVAMSRAAQEVQGAMVIAKKFPRDLFESERRILDECKRKSFAEDALYSFPKGGKTVDGPNIRMAEMLARNMGNIESGTVELERRHGESDVMTYAWDLETNTREVKIMTIRHARDSRDGGKKMLSDERDIYETIANYASRRRRACILAIVPGDIVEKAVTMCNKTIEGSSDVPLKDRITAMLEHFRQAYNVTQAQIEARYLKKAAALTEQDIIALRKIAASLKDGMADVVDFFPPEQAATQAPAQDAPPADGSHRTAKKKPAPAPEPAPQGAPEAPATAEDAAPEAAAIIRALYVRVDSKLMGAGLAINKDNAFAILDHLLGGNNNDISLQNKLSMATVDQALAWTDALVSMKKDEVLKIVGE